MEGDVHAKNNQGRSADKAYITKDLENGNRSSLLDDRGILEGHSQVQIQARPYDRGWSGDGCQDADVVCQTYLTVDWVLRIKINYVKND